MSSSDNLEGDAIVCSGFCDTAWHRNCVNITKTCHEAVKNKTRAQNYFWFCDRCVLIINNTLFKELFKNFHAGLKVLVKAINSAVDNLN
jgi:hypothetical protein